MELRRTVILIALAIVSYLLVLEWQRDYSPQSAPSTPTAAVQAAGDAPVVPIAENQASDVPVAVPVAASPTDVTVDNVSSLPAKTWIQVYTDVLHLSIDPVGGDVVSSKLLQHTKTIHSQEPFTLLENTAGRSYIAQSGLVGANGPDAAKTGRPVYQSNATTYRMEGDTLEVVLSLPAENGVAIQKVYSFKRGDYLVNVTYRINNQGTESWRGNLFAQLKRDSFEDPSSENHSFGMVTFLGGAWWSPEKSYNKVNLDDFATEGVNQTVQGGWAAIVQHYFVNAWVPSKDSNNTYTTRVVNGSNIIGFTSADVVAAPGQTAEVSAQLYTGPKIQETLEQIADGLELTVDFGWLWFISQFLFWLLEKIHGVLGNWGWSIVALTVLVKAAFYKLSASSYRSMANMRRVMPEMQRMKEQYGSDRQKLSQAMMELYKKEKINPLGGCLPILLQMPVFIALYWTLMESVELRHAPWMGWIQDLSVMDPYFVLPIIMGVTMWIQQHLNPAPPDPMQAKIMKIMPIAFTFMFLWFPAGLVLYWVVNNILSIAQQWMITNQIEKAAAKK